MQKTPQVAGHPTPATAGQGGTETPLSVLDLEPKCTTVCCDDTRAPKPAPDSTQMGVDLNSFIRDPSFSQKIL